MTVGELYSEVSQLGFETSLDDGTDRFYQAINRCLLQASFVMPVVKRLDLAHFLPRNLVASCCNERLHTTEDVIFEAEGAKAYAFEVSGNGSYIVEKLSDGEWTAAVQEDTFNVLGYKFERKSGLISDIESDQPVRIRFTGDYFFVVRNVAMYNQAFADAADIPASGKYTEYAMNDIVSDFNGFAKDPMDERTEYALRDFVILLQDRLLVRNDYFGTITVEYNHKPAHIEYTLDPYGDETPIDAEPEICSILPYLVASYVWIDDEPAKAQYYKVMYEERAQEIRNRLSVQTPIKINNNGW